jgi:hypothetical protein
MGMRKHALASLLGYQLDGAGSTGISSDGASTTNIGNTGQQQGAGRPVARTQLLGASMGFRLSSGAPVSE